MTFLLRTIGFSGFLLFAALFTFVSISPKAFERSALSFAKSEVTHEVFERYPDLAEAPLNEAVHEGLGRISQSLGIKQEQMSALANSSFPELIGSIVEDFCTCGPVSDDGSAARAVAIRSALEARASELGLEQTRVIAFVKGQYTDTVEALRADLMTFLSINALAFAAVLGATFVARDRRHAVIVPAGLLLIATVLSSAVYLIGTDWFYTIIFRDYAGWWYGFGLMFVFASMTDIVLNRARLTLKLLSHLPFGLFVPLC